MQDLQRSLGDQEVGQAKQAERLRRVLGQALVAGLCVSEHVLEHVELMLDFGARGRFHLFWLPEQSCPFASQFQGLSLTVLYRHVPVRSLHFLAFVHAAVAGVTIHRDFIVTQQRTGLGHIVDVGHRADHCVHLP